MSRLILDYDSPAEAKVKGLYEDLQRRLAVGPVTNCPVEQCKAFVELCLSESCGKCVPCRIGLRQINIILERILDGEAEGNEIEELKNLSQVIKDSADCAIGFGAAEAVSRSLESFEDDFKSHIENDRCNSDAIVVPCRGACPAHVDIPGYIALAKEKKYAEAVQLIRYDNPLPSICALVCEHPCEKACRRNMIDDAINIRAIKRMAVDNSENVPVPECLESTGKKVAIIGGGPAGLTCAYYLQLMGHQATIFEQRKQLGGMTRYGIPRYRLPDEYLAKDIDAILSTGVEVKTEVSIDTEGYKKLTEEYDAVYLAIGAHNANSLGIEGEDAENVLSAVEILRDMGDDNKPDFTGKRVVIVGGGNVAMDCTRTAMRLGAESVQCVYRRRQEDMTANPEEIQGALIELCELVTMKAPVRIEKDAEGKVAALIVQPQMPGAYDRGRPKPIKADKPEERIECDIIICAIGQAIDSAPFEAAGLPAKRSRFVADKGCKIFTDKNLYVGGDCQTGPATVIKAVEAGKVTAANIDEALGYKHVLERTIEVPAAPAGTAPMTGRVNLAERPGRDSKQDFGIIEFEMTDQECQQECSRCLRCDHHGMGAVKGGRASW